LISRYAKELVNEGVLEIPIKKARVKLYQPTPIGKRIKVNKIKGKNNKLLPLGGSTAENLPKIRHHRLSYKIEVRSQIRKIKWDRINRELNGITQYFLYWPTEKSPKITIRYQPSKKKGKFGQIAVWPTEYKLTFEEWKYWEEYLNKYIGRIYGWLMKIFQCELGLLMEYQPSEFGVPPKTILQKLACEENFMYGDCRADKSGGYEFESNDPVKAEAMRILMWGNEKIPQKVKQHQDWIVNFEKKFSQFLDRYEKHTELQSKRWDEHLQLESKKWDDNVKQWNDYKNFAELQSKRWDFQEIGWQQQFTFNNNILNLIENSDQKKGKDFTNIN